MPAADTSRARDSADRGIAVSRKSAISRQLAQLGEEMRSEIAIRDDELSREREELSYDAVDDIMNDVWPFPSLPLHPCYPLLLVFPAIVPSYTVRGWQAAHDMSDSGQQKTRTPSSSTAAVNLIRTIAQSTPGQWHK